MDKFRIRTRKEYFATILGFAGIFLIYFLIINTAIPKRIYFSPGDEIHIPTDCSNTEIKSAWDSIFYESSNGITIKNSSIPETPYCDFYFAYKENGNEFFFLSESNIIFLAEVKSFVAIHGNFSQSLRNEIKNTPIENITLMNLSAENLIINSLPRNITNITDGKNNFSEIFKISSDIWVTNLTEEGGTMYYFIENETIEDTTKIKWGIISANKTYESFLFSEILIPEFTFSCTPNWTKQVTACNSNENKVEYYIDEENCGNIIEIPPNKTIGCDYNSNGLIGILNDSNAENINLKIKINNTILNESTTYSGNQEVKILDNTQEIISFNWNFTKPFDLKELEIVEQGPLSNFGYIIINGLNITKKVYVNKLDPTSNSICIKDGVINDIAEISYNCNASEETKLICPGNDSKYNCNITAFGFELTGLTHSAAREISNQIIGGCLENWTCTSWSLCLNNKQNKTCVDSNNCGTNLTKPPIEQICTPQCTEDWKCGNWTPTDCPKSGNQTRTCIDAKACGTYLTKPSEEQICEYRNTKFWFITILIIVLLIGIIIGSIFYIMNTSGENKNISENLGYETNIPRPPNNTNNLPPQPKNNFINDSRKFYK